MRLKLSDPILINNSITTDFLSLSVTLSTPNKGWRYISFVPYNKRDGFDFVYPKLTIWTSKSPISVKKATLKTMVHYALLGSTQTAESVQFLCNIIDRLVLNGYPLKVLTQMWQLLVFDTFNTIPCRPALARTRNTIVWRISKYIRHIKSR